MSSIEFAVNPRVLKVTVITQDVYIIIQPLVKIMTESLVHESIDILSKSRYFGSKNKLLDEAVRTLLEVKPALKIEIAVELYKKGTVSLCRASEITGVSTQGFKEILASRGMVRVIKAPSKEKIKKEVKLILQG